MTLIEAAHCLTGRFLHPVHVRTRTDYVLLIGGRKEVKLAALMPCIHVTCRMPTTICMLTLPGLAHGAVQNE